LHILVINSGSSSIKFSVFSSGSAHWPDLLYQGEIGGIGAGQTFKFADAKGNAVGHAPKDTSAEPVELLESTLSGPGMPAVDAVGYRVVHPGPQLNRHQLITEEVLKDLEQAISFAPLHDPAAIALIREMRQRFPRARHYACFDTIFHHTMPLEASAYAIPSRYRQQGVRRYGFHGLSCESIVDELRVASQQGEAQFPARMVIAHLGSGCSVTAVLDGKSVDTSMGLTPTGGVVMGTRPGDLDPGLILYLLRQAEGDRDAALKAVEALLNHQSGMVALSGLPNDMRLTRKAADEGNADAVLSLKVFTRSVRKTIGSYAWLLGGLDAVVFTGGIGEHDALSRTEILEGLEACGVTLDRAANQSGSEKKRRINALYAPVTVWVITAQEDRMIAVHVSQMESKEKV
jgi:acetate kinase